MDESFGASRNSEGSGLIAAGSGGADPCDAEGAERYGSHRLQSLQQAGFVKRVDDQIHPQVLNNALKDKNSAPKPSVVVHSSQINGSKNDSRKADRVEPNNSAGVSF